ncbi:MAG: MerR family transcriptional regulator [Salinarimonas sp.]|jgi:DNA-binding transcriptional MerR regulator
MDSVKTISQEVSGFAEEGASEAKEYLISDLSREFGVTLRALRFYEDRGLLAPKRIGTMRIYSSRDRERLSVILKGKQLGFTLAEIQDMLTPTEQGGKGGIDLKLSLTKVEEQIAHLESQRDEIDAAIAALAETRDKLRSQG